MVSVLAVMSTPTNTSPASASAFRTTLDSDSRNVASASSLSSTRIALCNGPISVILGLKPSTGRTTGKETPPMSSDFDPLQAWPKPVQTRTR